MKRDSTKHISLYRLFSLCLAVLLSWSLPASSIKQNSFLAPFSDLPAVAQQESLQDMFLPSLADQLSVPDSFYDDLLKGKSVRTAYDITTGEEKARELIRLGMDPSGELDDFYLIFIDVNNLKLRNWIYTNEIMDVFLADFDNAMQRILNNVVRQIGNKAYSGFSYVNGGDERVVVLPTSDPEVVEQVMFQIQTYLRRLIKGKYQLGVLQLDGDSRIKTMGKENPKDDEVRRLLFEGEYYEEEVQNNNPGILRLLREKGVNVVQHSEQYFLVYENEDDLDQTFFEVQQEYPEHFVDFKPHAYYAGVLDSSTLTGVASSFKETLRDMNGSVKRTAPNILEQWVLRNEIASQTLSESGKDAVALLHPDADPLNQNRHRNDEKLEVLNNEDYILAQAQTRGSSLVFGQQDGRFFRMPNKKSAIQNTITNVRTSGYLVQIDIGYISDTIKAEVLKYEEEMRGQILKDNYDLDEEDEEDATFIRQKVREEMFKKFRVISPQLMGVNTKFLNEVLTHGGTDDVISAILTYVWEQVEKLNRELAERQRGDEFFHGWNAPIFTFRGPPDSIYLWMPVETGNGLNESEEIKVLKGAVRSILANVRGKVFRSTDVREKGANEEPIRGQLDPRIKLNFLTSVLSVKDSDQRKMIPRGDERKAGKLFENMERAYRVLMESVIKQNADKLDHVWRKKGGAAKNTRPETLARIRKQLVSEFQGQLTEIDPSFSDVDFKSLGDDKFMSGGDFFLVYNGNIEAKSETIQVELAVNSELEISRRDLLEKAEKWKRELKLYKETGRLNYNELFYVLTSMLERESELERFNRVAHDLGVKKEIDDKLGFKTDSSSMKEAAKVLRALMAGKEEGSLGGVAAFLEEVSSREIFDPAKIYTKLETERLRLVEKIYNLTGIYLDRELGARIPKKGEEIVIHHAYSDFGIGKDDISYSKGASRVVEILSDEFKREELKKLRQQYRELLQFTRYQPLFERFVRGYQELLDTMPRAETLLKQLSRQDPALYHHLIHVLYRSELSDVGAGVAAIKLPDEIKPKNDFVLPMLILSSVTQGQISSMRDRFATLVEEEGFSQLTQVQSDRAFDTAI